jgi:hypothetical protein
MHKNFVGKPEVKKLLENRDVDSDSSTINLKKSEIKNSKYINVWEQACLKLCWEDGFLKGEEFTEHLSNSRLIRNDSAA